MYKEFYAFINIENPLVAWEAAIGRIASSRTTRKGAGISLWMYRKLKSLSASKNRVAIHREFLLESVRKEFFPDAVSRLQGVYFFETKEDALKAYEFWEFNCPKEYLCKIGFYCQKYTKVDSNFITICMNSDDTDWMKQYWNGETYGEIPLYEIIAEGFGYIIEPHDVSQKAYDKFHKEQIMTNPLISMSRCAFSRGFINIARAIPFLSIEDNKLKGSFIIDMHDFDTNQQGIIKALEDCYNNEGLLPIIEFENTDTFFAVPDMHDQFFSLEFSETIMADISPHIEEQSPGA